MFSSFWQLQIPMEILISPSPGSSRLFFWWSSWRGLRSFLKKKSRFFNHLTRFILFGVQTTKGNNLTLAIFEESCEQDFNDDWVAGTKSEVPQSTVVTVRGCLRLSSAVPGIWDPVSVMRWFRVWDTMAESKLELVEAEPTAKPESVEAQLTAEPKSVEDDPRRTSEEATAVPEMLLVEQMPSFWFEVKVSRVVSPRLSISNCKSLWLRSSYLSKTVR